MAGLVAVVWVFVGVEVVDLEGVLLPTVDLLAVAVEVVRCVGVRVVGLVAAVLVGVDFADVLVGVRDTAEVEREATALPVVDFATGVELLVGAVLVGVVDLPEGDRRFTGALVAVVVEAVFALVLAAAVGVDLVGVDVADDEET